MGFYNCNMYILKIKFISVLKYIIFTLCFLFYFFVLLTIILQYCYFHACLLINERSPFTQQNIHFLCWDSLTADGESQLCSKTCEILAKC